MRKKEDETSTWNPRFSGGVSLMAEESDGRDYVNSSDGWCAEPPCYGAD